MKPLQQYFQLVRLYFHISQNEIWIKYLRNFMLNTCGRENKRKQRAKKVISDNPELADFTIGVVNPVLNLPAWQLTFF